MRRARSCPCGDEPPRRPRLVNSQELTGPDPRRGPLHGWPVQVAEVPVCSISAGHAPRNPRISRCVTGLNVWGLAGEVDGDEASCRDAGEGVFARLGCADEERKLLLFTARGEVRVP